MERWIVHVNYYTALLLTEESILVNTGNENGQRQQRNCFLYLFLFRQTTELVGVKQIVTP